jgi:HrpA-like RNA helicase
MDLINKNIDDILDINGINNNFINNLPLSEDFKILAQSWSLLPMYKDKKSVSKFFDLLHNTQVMLLVSGTGSGKTVLVPKFFYKYVITMGLLGKIAVTNPKQLTTIYNAEYGAKTLDIKLGDEIGYKYKGAPIDSISEKTKLIYCTDGLILTTILGGDKLLKDYQGVIIDEAHERHIQIDLLLKLIKDILPKRPDFKLIIMSATINAEIFRNYFNVKDIKYSEMEVSGESNFPINQIWLDKKIKLSRSNYIDIAIDKCLHIINTSDIGDILVFVPTTNDAKKGCLGIKSKCPATLTTKNITCDKLYCVEVYSKMKQSNKELAVSKDLYKSNGYDRKIIFATNVAESSITFDGLVYVVESGYELGNYYDYTDNSYVVTKKYTSQAQIKQRIGRAGRTQPGIAYHLYTEESFNKLDMYPTPNISVIDLSDFLLSLINYSRVLRNMINLVKGLITVPKIEQTLLALYKLHFIKAIKLVKSKDFDNNKDASSDDTLLLTNKDIKWKNIQQYNSLNDFMNGTITSLGFNILKFRSSPILSALTIIISYYLGCQKDIIIIMAICEITNGKFNMLFDYSKRELQNVTNYFKNYIHDGSDHLTVLNIYNQLFLENKLRYLHKKTLQTIQQRINQLEKYALLINETRYLYMNEKYKLVSKKPYDNIIDNIIYTLGISHYYNLLKKQSKNFVSVHYLRNSTAEIEHIDIMQNKKTHNYAICNTLVNAFGQKAFQCITQLPNHIITDIMKYEHFN